MNKERRLSIIKKYRDDYEPNRDVEKVICSFVAEELVYATMKSVRHNLDLKKGLEKVIESYIFLECILDLKTLSSLIRYCLYESEIVNMGHCFIDYIYYMGEFYDGTPCGEGKPCHTYSREWFGV